MLKRTFKKFTTTSSDYNKVKNAFLKAACEKGTDCTCVFEAKKAVINTANSKGNNTSYNYLAPNDFPTITAIWRMEDNEKKYLNSKSKAVISRTAQIAFIKNFLSNRLKYPDETVNKTSEYAGVIDIFGNPGSGKSEFLSQLPILLDLEVGTVVSLFSYNNSMERYDDDSRTFRILYGGLAYMPILYSKNKSKELLCENLVNFGIALEKFVSDPTYIEKNPRDTMNYLVQLYNNDENNKKALAILGIDEFSKFCDKTGDLKHQLMLEEIKKYTRIVSSKYRAVFMTSLQSDPTRDLIKASDSNTPVKHLYLNPLVPSDVIETINEECLKLKDIDYMLSLMDGYPRLVATYLKEAMDPKSNLYIPGDLKKLDRPKYLVKLMSYDFDNRVVPGITNIEGISKYFQMYYGRDDENSDLTNYYYTNNQNRWPPSLNPYIRNGTVLALPVDENSVYFSLQPFLVLRYLYDDKYNNNKLAYEYLKEHKNNNYDPLSWYLRICPVNMFTRKEVLPSERIAMLISIIAFIRRTKSEAPMMKEFFDIDADKIPYDAKIDFVEAPIKDKDKEKEKEKFKEFNENIAEKISKMETNSITCFECVAKYPKIDFVLGIKLEKKTYVFFCPVKALSSYNIKCALEKKEGSKQFHELMLSLKGEVSDKEDSKICADIREILIANKKKDEEIIFNVRAFLGYEKSLLETYIANNEKDFSEKEKNAIMKLLISYTMLSKYQFHPLLCLGQLTPMEWNIISYLEKMESGKSCQKTLTN